MILRRFLALAVLVVAAAPTFAEDFNLGALGVPSQKQFGNSFWLAGDYVDNYTFSISQEASASGLVVEMDPWWNWVNLDVKSVTLVGISSFAATGPINFGVLAAGTYTLKIASTVTWALGVPFTSASYVGKLRLSSLSGAPVTSVPEPGVVLIYGLGLIGVAFAVRRRNVAGARS